MVRSLDLDGGRARGGPVRLASLAALLLVIVATLVGLLAALQYPKFTACAGPDPGGGIHSSVVVSLRDC